jgi:hypothetical protein
MIKAIKKNPEFSIAIAFGILLAAAVITCSLVYGYHNPIAS